MTAVLTEDALGIFWNGEEHDGLLVYGYWNSHLAPWPTFPSLLWPAGTEVKPFQLWGDAWRVRAWNVKIVRWPDSELWLETLKSTMHAFIAAGALVSWCGTEGYFEDPPHLFSDAMGDGIYAGLTRELDFSCQSLIGQPFRTIDRVFLEQLRRAKDQSG